MLLSRRKKQLSCLFLLLLISSLFLPATSLAHPIYPVTSRTLLQAHALADFPTVDPNYIYDQLFYVATHFQRREAGYDKNLPVSINGHDEFAAYWSQEMLTNFQGFGPQVRRDQFPVNGWVGRPAIVPAVNVEVTVSGVTHPEQVVVIGCHYDGEAISTQSANDDASGCAIELGVAKAMGAYWRSHHVYPARTLRFVIFDAEEQGLIGSFHYVNETVNGDVHNIIAMFNEEQNGIAYPLRFLGKLANPLLPFYMDMSPLLNNQLYPGQTQLSQQQQNNISHFRDLMQQAVVPVFEQFQALGYTSFSYRNDNNQPVSQPAFTFDQLSNIHLGDDTLGGSDQIPFTKAGLPCATFVGNSTYYDANPPAWSYPFDQKEDTIQLMNTFASGSSQKAQALVLALAIPGMLTTWMLHQPDMLGEAAADGNPIATISDIGQAQVNQRLSLDAGASFDPGSASSALTYVWDFGDGSHVDTGVTISHKYTTTGTYTLALTVSSAKGTRRISKIINVVTHPTSYENPYAGYQPSGVPHPNPAVVLPTPDDAQTGKVSPTSTQTSTTPTQSTSGSPVWLFVGIGIIILFMLIVIVSTRRRKPLV